MNRESEVLVRCRFSDCLQLLATVGQQQDLRAGHSECCGNLQRCDSRSQTATFPVLLRQLFCSSWRGESVINARKGIFQYCRPHSVDPSIDNKTMIVHAGLRHPGSRVWAAIIIILSPPPRKTRRSPPAHQRLCLAGPSGWVKLMRHGSDRLSVPLAIEV